jgi:hypothetical protein
MWERATELPLVMSAWINFYLLASYADGWSVSDSAGSCVLDAALGQVQGMLLLPLLDNLGHEHLYIVCQGLKQAQ